MSKKCSNSSSSHGNRSASADSSYRVAWGPQMDVSGTGVLPSQPFVQDPKMPPLPLPNTTVQLEEVHRRLEADHTKMAPVKSKYVYSIFLTHCIRNRLSHTIYWKSPISVLGKPGYEIYIFLEKNGLFICKQWRT